MAHRLAVAADRVYVGDGQTVHEPGFIVIEGTRIASVGRDRPEADAFVSFDGGSAIPGFIDAHCHITLSGDGKTYEEQIRDPDEMMSLIAVRNMRRHLQSGVTTLRDNGGRNRVTFVVREAINRGYLTGPRLLLSGRPLTHSGGHFHFCNGVADSEAEIRTAVRLLVAEGADHIKIMASGGATQGNIPYYASYTAREMGWAVETAHALGRLTTAHCRAARSMENALDAGVDCLEHAEYLVPGEMNQFGIGVSPGGRMVYDAAITDRILDSGTWASLTLQAGGYTTLVALRHKAEEDALSPDEQEQMQALDSYYDMKLDILRRMLDGGMKPRIVISSDAGPFDVAFGELQHGLELAALAGMAPMDIIDAATRLAAEACGILDQVGTIEVGKQADLLLVEGNPLQKISDAWRVRQVFLEGNPVIAEPPDGASRLH